MRGLEVSGPGPPRGVINKTGTGVEQECGLDVLRSCVPQLETQCVERVCVGWCREIGDVIRVRRCTAACGHARISAKQSTRVPHRTEHSESQLTNRESIRARPLCRIAELPVTTEVREIRGVLGRETSNVLPRLSKHSEQESSCQVGTCRLRENAKAWRGGGGDRDRGSDGRGSCVGRAR